MSATGDEIRAQQAEADAITKGVRTEWEKFGTALSGYEKRSTDLQAAMLATAKTADGLVLPPAPTPQPPGIVIPPVPSGFSIVKAWDFTQPTLPAGWVDDGLTFNYGQGQLLDCVNLMRNVVYNATKRCWEFWGRKEDYPNTGKSGYWATAHYTAASLNVEAGWSPGQRVEIFARMNDQHRSCLWSSHGPDEFDFPEHMHSDAPQYNKPDSDHWNDISSYSPTVQNVKVLPALIDGKPHTFWCDYLVDGANVVMGRDSTTTNTVPKAKLASATMTHGIRVSEQMGGTWDGGYDAVQKGYWPSIQIPSAPSCSDLYLVRLLKRG